MKKGIIISFFVVATLILQSSVKKVTSSNFPPTNCTGAPNAYTCQFCHSTYSANMVGGGISLLGIPSSFSSGQSYPFSINIKHFINDRKKFGYDVTALDAFGNTYGTFSTTNANSTVDRSTGELTSHAPLTLTPANQTTISGFTWTAPKNIPNANQLPITFYFCGNACNGDGTVNGDYIYNDSLATTIGTLPVIIEKFVATRQSDKVVQLIWSFPNELMLRNFIIQKNSNRTSFIDIDSVTLKNGSIVNNTYSYVDVNSNNASSEAYRIKSIANDGSISFSKVQMVSPTIHFVGSSLYPNPVIKNQSMNYSFTSSENKVCNVTVLNSNGNLLLSKKHLITKGFNTIYLPIGKDFIVGSYFLVLSSESSIIDKQTFIVK